MNKEPIRHHYIPQFILKNFCFDNNGHVHYYNKAKSEFSVKEICNIFMARNLYRDEINNCDNPVKIENDLGKFENEVSQIIKSQFLHKDKIVLSADENEKLLLFFAIMSFRSKLTCDAFGEKILSESKVFYKYYQCNGNYNDLWKRNLGQLVNCRSLAEVIDNPHIDDPFKIFVLRDTFGIAGIYLSVVENQNGFEFVIGNTYPVVISGTLSKQIILPMYSIFPISPSRAILCVNNGVEGAPRDIAVLRECVFNRPFLNVYKNLLTIRVKKIYEEETGFINSVIMKEATEGYASFSPLKDLFVSKAY